MTTPRCGGSPVGARELSALRQMLRGARVGEATVAACLRAVIRYRARPDVTAVGLGFKAAAGVTDVDAAPCLRVHVRRKRPRGRLGCGVGIPVRFEGLRTDVIEGEYRTRHGAGGAALALDRRGRVDPLLPGVSISHARGHPGTVGMFVRGRSDPTSVYVLSAAHVLADTKSPKVGDSIVQPSAGHPQMATVARYSARSLLYDAAVARLADGVPWSNAVVDTPTTLFDADFPAFGIILKKSGLASDVTSARVDGIDSFEGLGPGMLLGPDPATDRGAPLASAGDSGAIWYEEPTARAIGLHVRGNPPGAATRFAVATSMVKLCDALHVDPKLRHA